MYVCVERLGLLSFFALYEFVLLRVPLFLCHLSLISDKITEILVMLDSTQRANAAAIIERERKGVDGERDMSQRRIEKKEQKRIHAIREMEEKQKKRKWVVLVQLKGWPCFFAPVLSLLDLYLTHDAPPRTQHRCNHIRRAKKAMLLSSFLLLSFLETAVITARPVMSSRGGWRLMLRLTGRFQPLKVYVCERGHQWIIAKERAKKPGFCSYCFK